ncbi:MAG: phosphatase PAP2 family protein [Terriglobia bacterium]
MAGSFLAGGNSFPSGHAITTWSLAVVIAEEYSDHKLVGVGAYSVATLVSVARYTSYNHFLSDVLVGSVFGGLMGHYVYRTHHVQETGNVRTGLKSRLLPAGISPALSSSRNRGLAPGGDGRSLPAPLSSQKQDSPLPGKRFYPVSNSPTRVLSPWVLKVVGKYSHIQKSRFTCQFLQNPLGTSGLEFFDFFASCSKVKLFSF